MVPLADTLNADTNYNNAIVNYEESSLVITSIKPIKKVIKSTIHTQITPMVKSYGDMAMLSHKGPREIL